VTVTWISSELAATWELRNEWARHLLAVELLRVERRDSFVIRSQSEKVRGTTPEEDEEEGEEEGEALD